jgi:glycosyltransferase involved in cell wall biosynthesis
MVSTDRGIFNERSTVRARMIEYSKLYKELHIVVFSTKRHEVEEISDNCDVYSTNSLSRLTYVFGAYKIGRKIIKDLNTNESILITCQDPFETGLVGFWLKKIKKSAELILQIHTDLFSPNFASHTFLNKIRLYISRFTLPHADFVRVVSNKIADSLVQKGIDKDKIIVKPIDVNVDHIKNGNASFNLHERFPKFRKIVLMVSRLESEKNIDLAIRAMKTVLGKIPDAGLIIVGSGTEQSKLEKLAYNLNISPSVAFVGWQNDLVSYYKGCDVFLVTSLYEGYGMTLKEAQSAGCRIVSTDVGIAREVGANIVDWDEKNIAEKLIKLL